MDWLNSLLWPRKRGVMLALHGYVIVAGLLLLVLGVTVGGVLDMALGVALAVLGATKVLEVIRNGRDA